MEGDVCSICGGDGRIANAFGGSMVTCPSCHGNGRKMEDRGFHDVTKTKPSHHKNAAQAAAKATWPSTLEGGQLATAVRDSGLLSAETKTRLIQEILDHEATHGRCTETFAKKIRKQVRVTK